MKNLFYKFLISILIVIAIIGIFSTINPDLSKPETISISTLAEQVKNNEVKSITVKEGVTLEVLKNDDTKEQSTKEFSESISELLGNFGITNEQLSQVQISISTDKSFESVMGSILPIALPILLVIFIVWFFMRQVQGANSKAMSFGQSQARQVNADKKNKITFKDVAGNEESKEELKEIVEFLKHPTKFTNLGAKIPKGVLLMGSPGTGKTLMAKAVAGEANVPFFAISGSEFVEMFVGVGASRVRDLFKKAKKASPSIIFVDEIDAVGRQRGSGLGGSHDEREQTLNQILVEMDGIETNDNVILIAATNRPDVLDPALLRPGRFDRRVVIDLPDINDREAILKVHGKDKPFSKKVNLKEVAQRTPGFSGADLANLLNEAAITTARENKKQIDHLTILESIEKVLLGPERKSHVMSKEEKKITAYHEAGHAIVAHFQPNTDPIHKISIISRGKAGGYTLKLPTEDRRLHTRQQFIEDIAVMLGGQAAEKTFFGDTTTGPSSDLKQATALAKAIVMDYGMDENLGPRTFGDRQEMIFLGKEIHGTRDYSEKTAQDIDEAIESLVKEGKATAQRLIDEHKDKMKEIANKLIEQETIEKKEFEEICGEKPKA